MSGTILISDDDQVVCKFNPTNEKEGWSISFPKPIFEFLADYVGDVHQWAAQQDDLIVRGQMKTPEAVSAMRRMRQGEKLSQRAINDLIRAHASSLYLTVKEDL